MDKELKLTALQWLRDKLYAEMDQLELDMDAQRDFYQEKRRELIELGEDPDDDYGIMDLDERYREAEDVCNNYNFVCQWMDLVIDQIENDE